MGQAAASAGAQAILDALRNRDTVAVVFASAVSQNEFLQALGEDTRIPWQRITAFHLDEYIGIDSGHPASFRGFLHGRLWHRVAPAVFHELNGDATDLDAEIRRYSDLLQQYPPAVGFLGIGENGHLAFNDPPVDFNDPQRVRAVDLDEVCRMQQVHDGAFAQLSDVPRRALTLTVPEIMRVPRLILNVPGPAKAEAVRRTVEGEVTPDCPASILQRHSDATLYLDHEAASRLRKQEPPSVSSPS